MKEVRKKANTSTAMKDRDEMVTTESRDWIKDNHMLDDVDQLCSTEEEERRERQKEAEKSTKISTTCSVEISMRRSRGRKSESD